MKKKIKQIKKFSLGSTNYNLFVSDFLQLGIKWQFFKVSIHVAWVNRRHLATPPTVSPKKLAQKFHTDDTSLPRSGWCFWSGVPCGKFASTKQKHYPDLGSDVSSVWNFCARFSDFISRGRPEMLSVFSGYNPCQFLPSEEKENDSFKSSVTKLDHYFWNSFGYQGMF